MAVVGVISRRVAQEQLLWEFFYREEASEQWPFTVVLFFAFCVATLLMSFSLPWTTSTLGRSPSSTPCEDIQHPDQDAVWVHKPSRCVCWRRPDIMLTDFNASLELTEDGTLELDPQRFAWESVHHCVTCGSFLIGTNSFWKVSTCRLLAHWDTSLWKAPCAALATAWMSFSCYPPCKADIFGFGLVTLLLFLNQDGPELESVRELRQLDLLVNQTVEPEQTMTQQQKHVLKKNKIKLFRPMEVTVSQG